MTIDLRRHNTVLAGDDRYFVFDDDGRARLVHDHCPHRGGPLSLGRRTADGRRLTCPWHGTRVGVAALCRTALPMVRTGDTATAVLPDPPAGGDGVPVTVIHRHILANLPPEAGGEGTTDATA
ncbi:Rieske 2Fe-2S domain-containing protein [Dactylosporangium aurantiacum]|uniref:Rieske 2Fe-2S domain-containing protein n=1 Tax=Dactylosporangium aurantiacum TaxID=35754 RepID=A0A9Q9MH97_9ACTN|nr:Rieske 2Fe-2S domain-containing protein [Dactylosporangium aurantiacum]MDG6107973.1 Rieske 2Fe-2S domain-containing protein [Dactylosporangium aurantiacum]UWZ59213.1 Rieske 2Fe-2S domain-containing protein [Dactylosporangium aurantiacum]